MSKPYILHTQCLSPAVEKKAAALGYASMIMFMCKRSSCFQVGALYFWIAPAIDHQQIAFFFNRTATPIGYVTWAHLADDVEHRLITDPDFLLHPAEWNEGGRTWIIDYCFPYGGSKESFHQLKDIFRAQGIEQVSWVRRNADYSVRKKVRCRLQESVAPYREGLYD
ncbi:toxin-activating lysine-acyltransferase [Pseudomonas sp. PDM24]|jgi:cytolysin-activating lysine-acyltransferase|uniref:toxin-activating lysine-acyltransferase n=1 Tax=Pseudomonas TaxID=286 RepID=UPI001C48D350|nr:toxin-activating lysine-acyltransferase [Pseudomonas sp. PDM24]MBV7496937.1 toxin-activating lysine-acyltransferase [Pseudomonas sp. PDM24]